MVMRQQVWIDRHVQGVLVGRVLLYWSGLLIYFVLSVGCFHWWQNPEWTLTEHLWGMFDQIGPCLPTMLVLLPLVIFDIVRLSNRFAGPIFRLRKHLGELSQDSQTAPLNFRDDDYWQQLADPINLLQQKMLVLEQQVQTLSFVHKSLNDGTLAADEAAASSAQSAPGEAAGEQREQVVHEDPIAHEPVHDAADEEALPPIPPLPSESPEAFVTLAAN